MSIKRRPYKRKQINNSTDQVLKRRNENVSKILYNLNNLLMKLKLKRMNRLKHHQMIFNKQKVKSQIHEHVIQELIKQMEI